MRARKMVKGKSLWCTCVAFIFLLQIFSHFYRELRCLRNTIHINLFLTYILWIFLWILTLTLQVRTLFDKMFNPIDFRIKKLSRISLFKPREMQDEVFNSILKCSKAHIRSGVKNFQSMESRFSSSHTLRDFLRDFFQLREQM